MPEKEPFDDPEMAERVARFLASGENPEGYYGSAETLLNAVGEVPDISAETRDLVVTAVQKLIGTTGLVDSFQLGVTFGSLFEQTTDRDGLNRIIQYTKNLDNVPFVNIRGDSVS